MNSKYLALLLTGFCLSCGTSSLSKAPKNTISETFSPKNIKIYTQSSKKNLGPCEPSICIDPSNPQHIVAGSVLDFVHTSSDSGKTWNTKRLTSELGIWGDPSIVADSKGNFYYFHLSDPDGTNWKSKRILDRIVVQKSSDKGNTWSSGNSIGLNVPKQQDKQWAAVNPTTNDIYVTWTEFDKYKSKDPKDKSRILFSKSTNAGENWSTPTLISDTEGDCLDDDRTTEGAVPCSNGTSVYVAWSHDYKIWFKKSTDNGATWQKEATEVAAQKAGWKFEIPGVKRANGFPVTDVDISNSKYNGTIYINWSDQNEDGTTVVFISKSNNEGKSWNAPKTINKLQHSTHQFFNWMSVDPATGYVYVVYYQEVSETSELVNVMLAVSKNGAKSFKNYLISESPFNPKGTNFFGDYNNIDVRNGLIRPIWTRADSGLLSIWTALIDQKDLDNKN